jgi:acyl-CoA reductase-like NAD-dependent aldehyde dehydrogenase
MSFNTDDEAIEIANCTPFGLKATVWSRDVGRLLRAIRGIKSGIVMGNSPGATVPQVGMPFGGYKMSGLGREYGMAGLLESFMETKSVFLKL